MSSVRYSFDGLRVLNSKEDARLSRMVFVHKSASAMEVTNSRRGTMSFNENKPRRLLSPPRDEKKIPDTPEFDECLAMMKITEEEAKCDEKETCPIEDEACCVEEEASITEDETSSVDEETFSFENGSSIDEVETTKDLPRVIKLAWELIEAILISIALVYIIDVLIVDSIPESFILWWVPVEEDFPLQESYLHSLTVIKVFTFFTSKVASIIERLLMFFYDMIMWL